MSARRAGHLLTRGMAWSLSFEGIRTPVGLLAMLLLVRIIPAADYGRAGVAVGLLALLNAFNCTVFMRQALQLSADREPDWSAHWSAGFYIQGTLSLGGHALAGVCWLSETYRPVAPLIHLAAIGLLFDWPNQLRAVMLRRAMDFRRLRMVETAAALLSVFTTVALGLAGAGAYAIVVGGNVVAGLPFAVDLLLVRGWRPRPGWWRWPVWREYAPALRFGSQQAVSGLMYAARGALEAAVLPLAFGFGAVGLWNRAQALYGLTAGRFKALLLDTMYPFLPRNLGDPDRYRRDATLFAQGLLWIVVPLGFFIGLEGPAVSRVLYGGKWVAMDPLIWPGVMAGLGLALYATGAAVLLSQGRLRTCLRLDLITVLLVGTAVSAIWLHGTLAGYAWSFAAGQAVAGALALAGASSSLRLSLGWTALAPAAVGAVAAGVALQGVLARMPALTPAGHLLLGALVYPAVYLLALRALFPARLAGLLAHLPGGGQLHGWLFLPGRLRPA